VSIILRLSILGIDDADRMTLTIVDGGIGFAMEFEDSCSSYFGIFCA
jgi:hypothetical protein